MSSLPPPASSLWKPPDTTPTAVRTGTQDSKMNPFSHERMNGMALRCLVSERTEHERGLTQSLFLKGQRIAVASMGLTRSQLSAG